MNAVATDKKPFSWSRFAKLAGVFYGVMLAAILPMFFLEKPLWIILALSFSVFAAVANFRIKEQDQTQWENFKASLMAGFLTLFLFIWGVGGQNVPIDWVVVLCLIMYVVITSACIVDKSRQ